MQTFNELGMSLAIVRWESDPHEITPTVTTVSVLVSAVAYVACFIAAPVYVNAMGDPSAARVVRVLALAILIDGFCNTPSGLLERAFQQGRKMLAAQVSGWIGTGITLFLALWGYGAMSLAIGQVIGALVCLLILLAFAPSSIRLGFDWAKARALFGFGLPLAGSNLVAFAVASTDQLVVGHLLGTVSLGFYVLALNMASWPLNLFSQPVRNVLPAMLSRLQHDRAVMRSIFLSSLGLLAAMALPACLLIGGAARPLIDFIYGARWLPAAQPLKFLAILVSLRILFELAYDYLVVLALSRFVLIVQLVWMLVLVPALIVGINFDGIYGAAVAEAAVAAFAVLPCYLHGLNSAGIKLSSLAKRLILPIIGASAAWLAAARIAIAIKSDFIALLVGGVACMLIIGLLIYRMRSAIALLRAEHKQPTDQIVSPYVETKAARDSVQVDSDLTAELAAIWGVIKVPDTGRESKARGNEALQRALLASRGSHGDITQPIPLYREIPKLPSAQPLEITSPLYRITVESLRWDPATGK